MSVIAQHIFQLEIAIIRPTIIRFCGTNHYSKHYLQLIESIIIQINYEFKLTDEYIKSKVYCNIDHEKTEKYDKVLKVFYYLIENYPVVLLLDGVDKLDNIGHCRSNLTFLKGIKPHKDSIIIVSTRPDYDVNINADNNNNVTYYGCHSCLKKVPLILLDQSEYNNNFNEKFIKSHYLSEYLHLKSCIGIIKSNLSQNNRNLTTSQWDYITKIITANKSISIFFLILINKLIIKWTSNQVEGQINDIYCYFLGNTTICLINQIFDHIEIEYGTLIIKTVCNLITFSRVGLNNIELIDILSMDNELMLYISNKYKPDIVKRFPSYLWFQIKNELEDLIEMNGNGCCYWKNELISNVVNKRYNVNSKFIPSSIGSYLCNQVVDNNLNLMPHLLTKNSSNNEFINCLPIWFNFNSISSRCSSDIWCLIEADMINKATEAVTYLPYICYCIKIGEGYEVIKILEHLYYYIEKELILLEVKSKFKNSNDNSSTTVSDLIINELQLKLDKVIVEYDNIKSEVQLKQLSSSSDCDNLQNELELELNKLNILSNKENHLLIQINEYEIKLNELNKQLILKKEKNYNGSLSISQSSLGQDMAKELIDIYKNREKDLNSYNKSMNLFQKNNKKIKINMENQKKKLDEMLNPTTKVSIIFIFLNSCNIYINSNISILYRMMN
jgi:hypothetical protein